MSARVVVREVAVVLDLREWPGTDRDAAVAVLADIREAGQDVAQLVRSWVIFQVNARVKAAGGADPA